MPSLPLCSLPPTATAASVSVGGHLPPPCPSLPSCGHRMSSRRLALSVSKTPGDTTVSSSSFREASPVSTFSVRRAAIAEVKESADLEASLSRVKGILRVHDLNIILRYFGESRWWREVNQLFDWMQKNEMLNFASYSSFIKYMRISRNPIKALQVYDSIADKSTKINLSICNSILGCMSQNGRFKSSLKLFSKMKDEGLLPDLVTYSTLLAGCGKETDGYAKAMQLVHELESSGFSKDAVIYGSLISTCASNNLCEKAEEYFNQMIVECCSPNIFHYSSLLNAYSVSRDYLKAEQLVRNMESSGIVPNKVILTTLLKVYARGGLFEKSRELLAELEARGYAEDEMPYCLLMDNLAKAGRMEDAREVFRKMKENKVKSDGFAHSIMISAFCRGGLLREARQFAKDFEENFEKYDLVMLNTLLRAYCNVGDRDRVMKMLRKMDECAISPDWNTFHILIKYFAREKLFHLAYRSVEDMHSKGHKLNELAKAGFPSESFSVYNMLRFSSRNVRKSLHETMLNILVEAGHLKDAYVIVKDNMEMISTRSLEKFAASFMKSGNINLINDVVKAFHCYGHHVNAEIFHEAISRYIGKPEKKELLLIMLKWMQTHGYVVDSTSRNLLLKNSHLFGPNQLIAEILSKQQASRMQRSYK
ncbi:pentatricopeptide repeat-containing protein At1g10910, chloroplastic isoform X2 [Phalaenopsis equestris]|uniref:pentatricopeptide repeat-containing protein At1g10910, chloroplastic isoform X2 n=1 Tax=Phalaenopsis equestris TaxID=78828 RepID=UPI0009E2A00A|nr:pentatricopeptide repeat-containing protein At1g10910, chloroplastic isoform X2 [Phalaenopsis equestris]